MNKREFAVAATSIPTVVIIGGGFSGAAVAWHLRRLAPHKQNIIIVEPRDEIGRGLAYDTIDPAHRINVSAVKMNLHSDEEGHFEQWLAATGYIERDRAAQRPDGRLYPAREAFGAYVNAHIRALSPAVTHRKTTARGVIAEQTGFRIQCNSGDEIHADAVVLAVCHTPPQVPASLATLQPHPRFISNPWQPGALRSIGRSDRVLIVGTGLTMADTVASLDRQGHRGNITAISRRGLRSQPHAPRDMEPYGDFLQKPAQTALSLLRQIRARIADASRERLSWHPVIDQVRLQGMDIWRTLPWRERARLIKHLRPFWDTHRFRTAPQIDEVITRKIANGTLATRAASIRTSSGHDFSNDGKIVVDTRARHGKSWERHSVDAVVIATGPAHGTVFKSIPLLAQINETGLARPDPLGLGIDVDWHSRAIRRDGRAADALFVAGPLARGTFGELMGVPDLARHAQQIAFSIREQLASVSNGRAREFQPSAY